MPADQMLTVGVDRTLLFAATDGTSSAEPWRSDGTAIGTVRVADLVPGPLSASPQQLARAGATVLFLGHDAVHGSELWSLPAALTRAAIADPFGVPCANGLAAKTTADGLPRVGNAAFLFGLRSAPAQALALIVVSVARNDTPLGACTLAAALPGATGSLVTDATGNGALPVAIPVDPVLVGTQIVAQWGFAQTNGPVFSQFGLATPLFLLIGG